MVTPQPQNVHNLPQKRISVVGSYQFFSRWLNVYVLYSKNETSWLVTAYLSLCQDGIRGWNHFAFM